MARIVMIAYTHYAVDARVKRHAQALADRGDSIDVICLTNQQDGNCNGVNVIGLRIPRYRGSSSISYILSYLWFFAAAAWKALLLAFQRRYDVAIVCSMPDAVVVCALPLKLLGTKVVLDVHDTMPELFQDKFPGWLGRTGAFLLKFEERFSALCADRIVAVHELHRRRLEATGIKRRKLVVVLNAPDRRIFQAETCATVPERRGAFVIVCHGTIARRLGVDLALNALALTGDRIPEARLLLIGSGDYLPEARRLIDQLNLRDRVELLQPMPLEQLPAVLRQASVGLIPNLASSATRLMLPVKLMEYAALNIPIVAARLETVEHYFGEDAIRFFEPNDAADLARALEEARSDESGNARRARNAGRILEDISWDRQRKNYLTTIDALCGSNVTLPIDLGVENRRQRLQHKSS